jgi:nitrogenase molybdenum-iron protein alpha/beta subunit
MPENPTERSCLDPYLRCAFAGAAKTVAGIRDACIVLHCPQGCHGLIGNALASQHVDFSEAHVVSSKLCEKEIVYGGEERLKETIRDAEAYGMPYLFILSACGPEVVGDDIAAVAELMAPESSAQILPIECAGFRGDEYQGIDLALGKLLDFAARDSGGKVKNSVTLIAPHASANPTWHADLAWVRGVLGQMGVTVVSVLTHLQDMEGIARTPSAETSLLLSHDAGGGIADRLAERYDIEPVCRQIPLPIGLSNTRRWLETLGQRFGAEQTAQELIEEGHEQVICAIRLRGPGIAFFHRVEAAIVADATVGIPLVRLIMEDLEAIPCSIFLRSSDETARSILKRELEELTLATPVTLDADAYDVKQGLRESKPACVFGSMVEHHLAQELGIPFSFNVISPTDRFYMTDRPYFGYEGLLHLLEILENDHQQRWRSREKRYRSKW